MKRLVLVSDLHVGSTVGLCPPVVPMESGGAYHANPIQLGLYKAWKAGTTGYWAEPDFLVLGGDMVDGPNKKEAGHDLWTADILSQVAVARDLIRMWNARCTYVVRGTHYHTHINGQPMEEVLARELKAQPFPPQFNRDRRSGTSLYLTVQGVTLHVAHKCGVRSSHPMYRSTGITREMMLAKLNSEITDEMKDYDVDIVVRGHQHFFWRSESTSHVGLMLPGWQLKSEHADSENPLGWIPDVGFVGIEIEGPDYAISKVITKLEDVALPPHAIHTGGGKRATNREGGDAGCRADA